MKNPIIFLCFVLTASISLAQAQVKPESSSHLSFKGVPINGTLREYIVKMEKNGFTQIGTEDGIALLQGDFASYKNCMVGVATLKQKDLVSKITVIFPELETWSSLSSNYFSLKEMLTEKYGEPADYVEKFDGITPRDDFSRMHELKMDNCKYYTTFETEKGRIQLSIEHNGPMSCYVMLAYYDKINGDVIRSKAMDDL
jgi:hypothetical protein